MALKLVSICYAVIILMGCSNKQYEMYICYLLVLFEMISRILLVVVFRVFLKKEKFREKEY